MFGDLIYTDNQKSTPTSKSILGKVKDEFLVHFNPEFGVWVHWSPHFIDIFSVPKDYRLAMFGQFEISPEEAIEEFLADMAPDARKLRKAQLAMMNHWNEIETSKKKKFVKHFGKTFGLNSLFIGPAGAFMNLAMMLLMCSEEEEIEDEDEMTSIFILALLMGMENKGPDPLQDLIKNLAKESDSFQSAVLYIERARENGVSMDFLKDELEHKMDNNQVIKYRPGRI